MGNVISVVGRFSDHQGEAAVSVLRKGKKFGVGVARLDFSIPVIERFDIVGGLLAVLDALERRIKT